MKRTAIFDMYQTIYRLDDSPAVNQEKEVIEMPAALEVLLSLYHQGYKIVIISSNSVQHSRDMLQILFEKKSIPNWPLILKEIDIISMRFFGPKQSVGAWKMAMSPYLNIDYIFEDGEEKLAAAGQAAQQLGSQPELFTSTANYHD